LSKKSSISEEVLERCITPRFLSQFENIELISGSSSIENRGVLVFHGMHKVAKAESEICAFNNDSRLAKVNQNSALTLFLKETFRFFGKKPENSATFDAIDSFDLTIDHESGLIRACYSKWKEPNEKNNDDRSGGVMMRIDCSDLLKDILADFLLISNHHSQRHCFTGNVLIPTAEIRRELVVAVIAQTTDTPTNLKSSCSSSPTTRYRIHDWISKIILPPSPSTVYIEEDDDLQYLALSILELSSLERVDFSSLLLQTLYQLLKLVMKQLLQQQDGIIKIFFDPN
jgi:hypothetical protein